MSSSEAANLFASGDSVSTAITVTDDITAAEVDIEDLDPEKVEYLLLIAHEIELTMLRKLLKTWSYGGGYWLFALGEILLIPTYCTVSRHSAIYTAAYTV